MAVLYEDVIPAWYGFCTMLGPSFHESPWRSNLMDLPDLSNGLVAAVPDGIQLITGTVHGDLRLTVELLDSAPEPQPLDWEAVVDVSLLITDGTLADGDAELEFRLPEPGWYRLRASARGRADAHAHHYGLGDYEDEDKDAPVEEHRITLWLASPREELVWKHDGLRGAAGRRPLPALGLGSDPEDLNGLYGDSPGDATP
ncbi:hypothetical protein ACFYWY_36910 [Streptomyces sp. NPDC002870]|uniref:hypothetical protein n=1 Tax=Streptomyces sp. NPDC002870 TaxID=3364666 RepID=UPI00369D1993